MKIKVLTIFPEMLEPVLHSSILGRAMEKGLLEVELVNIRDYSKNKHKNTDDYPFGGGAGMVMLAQPIVDAMRAAMGENFQGRRIYLSPRGRTLNQQIVEELAGEQELILLCGHYEGVEELAGEQELILLCGHYEGVDQRALDLVIDEELSVGDYVLTGGELPALIVIDAVSRLIPGVLGSEESPEDESLSTGLLANTPGPGCLRGWRRRRCF